MSAFDVHPKYLMRPMYYSLLKSLSEHNRGTWTTDQPFPLTLDPAGFC